MRIAQLSDPHFSSDAGESASARRETFRRALAQLCAEPGRPDLLLVTGDLTDHGRSEEYADFTAAIADLPMPVHTVPGNHDDRGRYLEARGREGAQHMDGFAQYVLDAGPLRLIALDTVRPGSDAGELCEARLRWLEARLVEAPSRPTLVFMHHPPFLTGMEVLDALGLEQRDALAAVIARHPQVERLVAGHIHCTLTRRFAGTLAMTCTSTSMRIRVDRDSPATLHSTQEPPSFLVHEWHARTGLVSHAEPLGDHAPFRMIHDGERWVP